MGSVGTAVATFLVVRTVTPIYQATAKVLVDADLRRPDVHRVFSSDNTKGLTNALLGTI